MANKIEDELIDEMSEDESNEPIEGLEEYGEFEAYGSDEEDETEGSEPDNLELDSEEKVRMMAEAADSVRAMDITVLDLRGITIISDFFLICTGKSSIQIRAVADRIQERLREMGIKKLRAEGYKEATWILLDYGDVVAHVMAAEQREFYNLEGFWSSAPQLPLELVTESASLAAGSPSVADRSTV